MRSSSSSSICLWRGIGAGASSSDLRCRATAPPPAVQQPSGGPGKQGGGGACQQRHQRGLRRGQQQHGAGMECCHCGRREQGHSLGQREVGATASCSVQGGCVCSVDQGQCGAVSAAGEGRQGAGQQRGAGNGGWHSVDAIGAGCCASEGAEEGGLGCITRLNASAAQGEGHSPCTQGPCHGGVREDSRRQA